MRILSRYILRDFAVASAVVLFGFLGIWAGADTLLHIDELGAKGLVALRDVAYRSIDILPLGLPMSCAIGVTWSLTRLARFRELTAIRCGGIALRRALLPLLAACLLMGLGLGFFEDRVLVPAHLYLRGGGGPSAGQEDMPRLVSQRWWYTSGSWLLSAGMFDADTDSLEEVTAFLLGPDRQIAERLDAQRARLLEDGRWQLEQVEVRTFSGAGVELSRLPERVIDLGLRKEALASMREPQYMSLRSLWRGAFSGALQGANTRAIAVEFHQRLAHLLAILLLVLASIPFAVRDVERGDSFSRALLQTLGAAVAFWALWTLALVTSQQAGWANPGVPIWTLIGLALVAAAFRYRTIDS